MYQVDASPLDGWPDPPALEVAATPLMENAQGIVNVVQTAASEWSAMAEAYRAPEAPELLALFKPVTQKAEGIRSGLTVVYRALMAYVDGLRDLNRRRDLLLEEIGQFHRERDRYEERTALLEQVGDLTAPAGGTALALQVADLERRVRLLAAEHEQAQQDCASLIRRVYSIDPSVPVYYDGGAAREFRADFTRFRLQKLEANGGGGPDGARETLALLKSLTPGQLLDYGLAETDYLRNGLKVQPAVAYVQGWWAGLSSEQQAALMVAAPGIIGNLNGIPYAVRAKANRANLDAVYNDTRTSEADKVALRAIYASLVPADELQSPARSIVSFTPKENGKPLVAVAIGDLDTAANVTWNVPGMKTTVADGLKSWTLSAQDLYNGQGRALDEAELKAGRAVVSWVGYDTPEAPPSGEVLSTDLAKAGGVKLAAALDGFSETRAVIGGKVRLNVVAHSYGTTTASYALKAVTHEVSTATFFGSAGIEGQEVGSAADLHVAKDDAGQREVYLTAAQEDRVAPLGIFGSGLRGREGRSDPTGEWFGGKTFSSEGGYDPDTGDFYMRTTGHDAKGWAGDGSGDSVFAATTGHGYLDPDTESARDIALTSTGHGDKIRQLLPLQRETQTGYGGMDFPVGSWIERDLTPEELAEEQGK
jgi:hypothetical protein